MKKILFCLALLFLGVGCQPVVQTQLAPQSTPKIGFTTPIQPIQEPEKDSPPMKEYTPSPGMEPLIKKAKEDLAQRLSIEVTEINLIEAREVVWPDASLGCPQPGMKYKQVPEDGALIILETQGATYDYHNGGRRGLFLCEKVVSNPEKPPQIDITDLTPRLRDNTDPPPPTPDNNIPPGEDQ